MPYTTAGDRFLNSIVSIQALRAVAAISVALLHFNAVALMLVGTADAPIDWVRHALTPVAPAAGDQARPGHLPMWARLCLITASAATVWLFLNKPE
jgi:hypothetical protein